MKCYLFLFPIPVKPTEKVCVPVKVTVDLGCVCDGAWYVKMDEQVTYKYAITGTQAVLMGLLNSSPGDSSGKAPSSASSSSAFPAISLGFTIFG